MRGSDSTTAGQFVIEPPTLLCLGFEWKIEGDDNRNASVNVQYRQRGATQWRVALPLLRIGDERVWRSREFMEHITPRLFAGSILDLEPNTDYECRLSMSDPDGVHGQSQQNVIVRTRGFPKAYPGGRIRHVYPPDYTGERKEPSF